jgi:hypothetical protein
MNHDHGNAKAVETADPIVPDCLYAVIGVPSRMDELGNQMQGCLPACLPVS